MKNLVLISLLFFTSTSELQWGADFEAAKTEAADSNKKILIVFSGSDWCKPCIQLHNTLFESAEFATFAKDNLLLVKADFPSRKKNQLSKEQTKRNEALAAAYNDAGEFPLAVFTNAQGLVLGTFGFDKTKKPADYISEFTKYLK